MLNPSKFFALTCLSALIDDWFGFRALWVDWKESFSLLQPKIKLNKIKKIKNLFQNTVGYALVDTLMYYNWTTLGMIYNNDLCSQLIMPSVTEALEEYAKEINIPLMLNLQNSSDNLEQHLNDLRKSARSKQVQQRNVRNRLFATEPFITCFSRNNLLMNILVLKISLFWYYTLYVIFRYISLYVALNKPLLQ